MMIARRNVPLIKSPMKGTTIQQQKGESTKVKITIPHILSGEAFELGRYDDTPELK